MIFPIQTFSEDGHRHRGSRRARTARKIEPGGRLSGKSLCESDVGRRALVGGRNNMGGTGRSTMLRKGEAGRPEVGTGGRQEAARAEGRDAGTPDAARPTGRRPRVRQEAGQSGTSPRQHWSLDRIEQNARLSLMLRFLAASDNLPSVQSFWVYILVAVHCASERRLEDVRNRSRLVAGA